MKVIPFPASIARTFRLLARQLYAPYDGLSQDEKIELWRKTHEPQESRNRRRES
jgi:hypothetical protein